MPLKISSLVVLLTVLVFRAAFVPAAETPRTLIQNRGSDSMAVAIVEWAEEYKLRHRNVGLTVSGGGTSTGLAALINGTVDIANASRPMNRQEISLAREHGIAPVQYLVGYDAVAIYVHRDNPVGSISFDRLADIFGADGTTESWTDLGVEVPGCDGQGIIRVSRQNSSGTHAYLRNHVLDGHRFRQDTLAAQSSKDLVELIASTPCAIGYSSLAYAVPGVRTVCVSERPEQACLQPSIEGIVEHTYPISRPLFMYTSEPASGVVRDYLDWIRSDEGQCVLMRHQYAPIRKVDCGG